MKQTKNKKQNCIKTFAAVFLVFGICSLLWSLPAQALDFTLTTSGPHHVVQGHYLFFTVAGQVTSGDDESATPAVSGLPPGAAASFPNQTRFCCGTSVWVITGDNPVKIATSANTPLGTYPLTITYTSTSGVIRSTIFDLMVDPVPQAITKVPFPPDVPLASLAKWQSDMTTYGLKHCRPEEMGMWEGFVWYYDGARVYYQIADYTNDPATWNPCAQMVETLFQDYVLGANGGVPGWRAFAQGFKMNYLRTGNASAKQAVTALYTNDPWASLANIAYVIGWQSSREVSYGLEVSLINESLGGTRTQTFYDLVEVLIGHFDQWFLSKNAAFTQPFMVALAAEAMIAYWDVTHDSRVPPMLKLAADQIWQQSWDATNQCFKYYADDGSISLSQDLNLLIVPLYGWVYQQTGDVKYRDEGDQIFNAGVAGAWLDGGKQYSQNYRWSGKYVEWRSGVTPPPGALPQTLALDFADGAVLPTDAVLQVKYNPGPGFANLQYVWTLAPAGSVGASGRRSLGVGAIAAPVSERTSAPSLGLDRWAPLPGLYTVSVYATDGTSQSNTAAQTLTLVNADLSGVKVYPNPWRKDKHAGGNITFAGLPTNVTVKIFTASGHLVREAGGVSNEWRWDRKTDQGDEAASGVYLYLITDSQGNKKRGKVAIIR